MQTYTVSSGSVAVRSAASASARVINVLPEGSTIYVVDEDSGWLRTSGGYYIFKTDNLSLARPRTIFRASSDPPTTSTGNPAYNAPEYNGYDKVAQQVFDEKKKKKEENKEQEEAKKDTPVAPQDQADSNDAKVNTQTKEAKLTNTVKGGHVKVTQTVKTNEKGEIVTDSNGNYEMVDLPAGTDTGKLVAVEVKEHNGKLYLVSESPDGKQYVSELANSEVGQKDQKSGTVVYKKGSDLEKEAEIEQDEEAKKQEETLLTQIANIGARIITAYFDLAELTVEDSRTIHGMPYQFMPIVDPRIKEGKEVTAFNSFGRKFNEKIVARAPILYMQAGLPIFLRGYSDEAKGKMLQSLLMQVESVTDDEVSKLIDNNNAQYYSFEEQSNLYFKAVNTACSALAHLLQIESVQIDTIQPSDSVNKDSWGQTISEFLNPKALGQINWSMRTRKSLGYYRGAVAFYINSENQKWRIKLIRYLIVSWKLNI